MILFRYSLVLTVFIFTSNNVLAGAPLQGAPDRVPQLEMSKEIDPNRPKPLEIAPIKIPASDAGKKAAIAMIPSKFEIVGLSALPAEEIQALLNTMLGKPQTLAQLVGGVAKVTSYLQTKGYVLSYAYLPPQDFKGKVVKVGIVEGYLNAVNIQGNPGHAENNIREIGQKLLDERPLTKKTFEYYSQVFAQLNGIKAGISAQPAANFEAGTTLNINIDRKAFTGTLGIVPGVNGVDPILTFATNSLTEQAEHISLSIIPTKENQYVGLNYAQSIGLRGDKFLAQVSYNRNEQDVNLFNQVNLNYETKNLRLGLFYSHPLVLQANKQLAATIGFYGDERDDVYTNTANGLSASIGTNTRVLAIELNQTFTLSNYQTQGSIGLFKGFDSLGASQEGNFIDLDFIRYRGQASISYIQKSGFGWAASAIGQYSDDILPPSEKIIMGNRFFAQGYPVGEASGDKGYGGLFEANYSFDLNKQYIKQFQPYFILDMARVDLNNVGGVNRSLSSFGLGVRVSNRNNYNVDINIAKPTGEEPIGQNNRSPRLNFSYYVAF